MLLPAVNFCKTFAHMSTFAKLLHAYQNFTWTLHLSTALQRRRFRWVLYFEFATDSYGLNRAHHPRWYQWTYYWIVDEKDWINSFPVSAKLVIKKTSEVSQLDIFPPGPIASSLPTLLTNRRLNPISAPLSKNVLGHLGVKKNAKINFFWERPTQIGSEKILFNIYSARWRTGSHSENF